MGSSLAHSDMGSRLASVDMGRHGSITSESCDTDVGGGDDNSVKSHRSERKRHSRSESRAPRTTEHHRTTRPETSFWADTSIDSGDHSNYPREQPTYDSTKPTHYRDLSDTIHSRSSSASHETGSDNGSISSGKRSVGFSSTYMYVFDKSEPTGSLDKSSIGTYDTLNSKEPSAAWTQAMKDYETRMDEGTLKMSKLAIAAEVFSSLFGIRASWLARHSKSTRLAREESRRLNDSEESLAYGDLSDYEATGVSNGEADDCCEHPISDTEGFPDRGLFQQKFLDKVVFSNPSDSVMCDYHSNEI